MEEEKQDAVSAPEETTEVSSGPAEEVKPEEPKEETPEVPAE